MIFQVVEITPNHSEPRFIIELCASEEEAVQRAKFLQKIMQAANPVCEWDGHPCDYDEALSHIAVEELFVTEGDYDTDVVWEGYTYCNFKES